jgi:Tol biopolymer transport system component
MSSKHRVSWSVWVLVLIALALLIPGSMPMIHLDQAQAQQQFGGDCDPNQIVCRVSIGAGNPQGAAGTRSISISADGRFVAFEADVSKPIGASADAFVYDRVNEETGLISVSSSGEEADNTSDYVDISANGRFVAFLSAASNLVPGDVEFKRDVFVHDRDTGETTLIPGGAIESFESFLPYPNPSISADGRYVAFTSDIADLVPGDTNGAGDIFVYDRNTSATTRVSVSSGGGQGNGWSYDSSISADGRYVAFVSAATNLVANDTDAAGESQ